MTLLNSLISSKGISITSLGFFGYIIMSSVSRQFYFVLSNMYILISFPYLIALTKTAGIMLNRNSKSGYHCLVPNLRRKACSLSSVNMMLAAEFFVDALSQVE